jgi:hypothetical protein
MVWSKGQDKGWGNREKIAGNQGIIWYFCGFLGILESGEEG